MNDETSIAAPLHRCDRRRDRSVAVRRRASRLAATCLAIGTALLTTGVFFVSVGGAAGSVTVTPNTGLTDGQTVTVSWTGLTPNFSPVIEQCKAAPTNPTTDCDFLSLAVSDSNSSGAGSDSFTVFAGSGPSDLFACDNANDCTIRVADDPNDITTGAIATITFSTAATTTTSTSTTSTSSTSTSSTSSSSTSSTTSTTSPDGSTTTSTTTADGSTTTTTLGTSVLGTSTDSSSGSSGDGSGLVLAFTGTALHLPFTLVAGAVLLVAGLALRRFALAST